MANAVITLSNATFDNTQKRIHIYCQVNISNATYPAGGIPFDSVILALPGATTNSGVKFTIVQSETGSGYIYQRIPSTGKLMILQVPPNGSLTTAAPLQQIPSSTNMQGIANDVIGAHITMLRNT